MMHTEFSECRFLGRFNSISEISTELKDGDYALIIRPDVRYVFAGGEWFESGQASIRNQKWFKAKKTLYFNFHKDCWDVNKPDNGEQFRNDYVLVRRGTTFLFQNSEGKYVGHTASTNRCFIEFSSEEALISSGWFDEVCDAQNK